MKRRNGVNKMDSKEEIREYVLDGEQGNFPLFDILDLDEFRSLMKSNRFSPNERNIIKQLYIPMRIIRGYIPIIAICSMTHFILSILKQKQTGDETE